MTTATPAYQPITFTTTSTVVEPKKRGRSKKNSTASTTTTTNTTTITITPKFIEVDSSGEGAEAEDCLGSIDYNFKNEIVSPSVSEDTNKNMNNANEININIHTENIDTEGMNVSEENTKDAEEAEDAEDDGLYKLTQFGYDILIPFVLINMHASSRSSILALLHTTLVSCIEGRCISEGFIKPGTVQIVDFKCGKIVAKNVQFNLIIECKICNPDQNSTINCIANNITQAGIRAISNDKHLPVVVYISRDYSMLTQNSYYNTIKEGDKIIVKVIGKRFEMNDKFIQIIGELVSPKKERSSLKAPKTIVSSTNTTNLGSMGKIISTSTSTSSSTSSSTSTTAPQKVIKESKLTSKVPKVPKEPKAPKEPKEPKAPKEPKEPKAPKEPKTVKKSIKSNVEA